MATKGVFGYIIGKKKRMMKVEDDADILWQILVREIYILINHYKTKEKLQEAFSLIKICKKNFKGFNQEGRWWWDTSISPYFVWGFGSLAFGVFLTAVWQVCLPEVSDSNN